MLRRIADRGAVRALWEGARSAPASRCTCPSCRQTMREVQLTTHRDPLRLDVCRGCHLTWFDPGEFRYLTTVLPYVPPPAAGQRAPRSERQKEVEAEFELAHEDFKRRARERDGPEENWQWAAGLMGLPVAVDTPVHGRGPLVTNVLLILCTLVFLVTLSSLERTLLSWGLRPSEPFRHGGLTWITSFFLHADPMHLIGNAVYLWVFGAPVEQVLGPRRFLGLIAAAALVGDVAYALAASDPTIVCVGASGGVSGALAWYAMAFPRARIAFLIFYMHWFHLPARVWLGLWVLLQVLGPILSDAPVAYAAHLGGAAVGVGAYLWGRRAA
jgi:membrane associated rhomboid family serine protease